jgi:hypothetical protein
MPLGEPRHMQYATVAHHAQLAFRIERVVVSMRTSVMTLGSYALLAFACPGVLALFTVLRDSNDLSLQEAPYSLP